MIRGIEGRRIFFGREDRIDLVERLDRLVPELGFRCFGWVLMPNHVHLAVQSGPVRLSRLMARLETGYARSFNLRHRRRGYLFQNRFRSRVVTGDADLVGVVRYLYRNPLEAGVVSSIGELAHWPWSGFSALTRARVSRPFEAVGATLALFGHDPDSACRRLLGHLSCAVPGEVNSALLTPALSLASEWSPDESPRERVVDRRGTVARLKQPADTQLRGLIERVCREHDLDPAALRLRTRARAVSRVRALVSYQAVVELGIPGLVVAKALGVSPSAVSHLLKRGRVLCTGEPVKLG